MLGLKSIDRLTIFAVVLIVEVFTFTGISAYSETGKRGEAIQVKKGQALYEVHCIACHNRNGVGETPIPWGFRDPDYLLAIPLNESSHAWHHGDDQLVSMILNGIPGNPRMPARSSLISEEQARQIVAYIKSLWSDTILDCQGPKHMSCMH